MLIKVIPVLFAISVMPGLCMLLALNLGLRLGVGRTLWMMAGELSALSLIAIFALMGMSAIVLTSPIAYLLIRFLGGGYLVYIGVRMVLSDGRVTDSETSDMETSPYALARLGFVVAASNPKAWILYAAILPAFLYPERSLLPQVTEIVALLLAIELTSLLLYAGGGHGLRLFLAKEKIVKAVNIVFGFTIIGSWVAMLISA